MVTREIESEIRQLAREFPVVSIYGPRQAGKTTLAKMAFPDKPWVSLESPDNLEFARSDPRGFLANFKAGAIIDEIQRFPELLSYLQEEVDRDREANGRFILTGSHQARLKKGITQSLAGRTAVLTLLPYSLKELGDSAFADGNVFKLMLRGFYPGLHGRGSGVRSSSYFTSYVATYLERDLPDLLDVRNIGQFRDMLFLLASRVGQLFNATSIANDIGVSVPTIASWVNALEESGIIFRLHAWSRNATVQVAKSPKIYFTDTGLCAWLAKIRRVEELEGGMLRGGLCENLVILEAYKSILNAGGDGFLYFYRDKAGREVDLIIERGNRIIPVEIKSSSTLSPDFHKGIDFFRSFVPASEPGIIAYNGDCAIPRYGDCRVVNIMKDQSWTDPVPQVD